MGPKTHTHKWAVLIQPLNLAGFGTWLLITVGQLFALGTHGNPRAWPVLLPLLAFGSFFALLLLMYSGTQASRARVLVLMLVLLALLDGVLVPGISGPILLVIAAAILPYYVSLSWSVAVLLVANLCWYFIFGALWGSPQPLYLTALYAGFQAFAFLTARLRSAAEAARDDLARTNAQLLATRSLLESAARDGERLRLSRELHDLAGHRLTALKLNLELARRVPETQRAARIDTALEVSDGLLDDLHGVVGQLRAHDGLQLQQALHQLAGALPGVEVRFELDPALTLVDVDTAAVLMRCVQEALTNAVRHGGAQRVEVCLHARADGVALEIRDDGRGTKQVQPGHGLRGMRERLENLDGHLAFDSPSDGGFVLQAWVPAT